MRALPFASPAARTRARHHRRCECDRDTLQTTWKAEMCQILHTRDQDQVRSLLDEFLLANEVEIARVVRRAQRVAHLDYRDKHAAMSYFGQALMKMVDSRWRSKSGRSEERRVGKGGGGRRSVWGGEERGGIGGGRAE